MVSGLGPLPQIELYAERDNSTHNQQKIFRISI
jgi:hypothetical protein